MRRLFLSLVILACGGLSMAAAHQERAASVRKVRGIQNVRDNLYFITGGDTYEVGEGRPTYTGGNVAVFVTEEGVVLVDSMLSGSGPEILEQIKKVTEKPIIMLINTHTHYDHTGSNTELPAAVDFVAHENTKTSLSKATCEPVTNCDSFKGDNAKFLPETTFEDKMSLLSGKDQIDLYYFGRGHTDGDAWVAGDIFPAVRAMHAGDMFQRKNMPAITAGNGGSATEFAHTLNKALEGIANVDTVIGGHTPTVSTWLDFEDFVDFYSDFFAFVQTEKSAGQSAAQVASAYRVGARYIGYYADRNRVRGNVQAIFDGE